MSKKRKRTLVIPPQHSREFAIPLLLFLIILGVYSLGISPTVTGGDVGDFLTAIYTRSLPHPPGFPLYMMVGILFSFLPLPFSFTFTIGLLSSISMALAAVLFFFLVRRVTKNSLVSLTSACALAFVYPFWLYAEIAEVFAFTVMFEVLLIYIAILYYQEKKLKYLYLLSFVGGLSLSAHQLLIELLPGVAVLVVITNPRAFLQRKVLFISLGFFIIGLLPYLFVPLASLFDTTHKWGSMQSISDVVRFVLRLDYGWAAGASGKVTDALLAMYVYIQYLINTFSYVVLLLSVFGIAYGWRTNKGLTLSMLVALIVSGPFFVVYGAMIPHNDAVMGAIERFYLISGVLILFFMALGVYALGLFITVQLQKLRPTSTKDKLLSGVLTIFFLIPLFFFLQNKEAVDFSRVMIGEHFATDGIRQLPSNSLLLSFTDTVTLNTLYVQEVLGVRQDIRLLSRLPMSQYVADNPLLLKKRDRLLLQNPLLTRADANVLAIITASPSSDIVFTTTIPPLKGQENGAIWIPFGLVYKLETPDDQRVPVEEYLKTQHAIWERAHLSDIAAMHQNGKLSLVQREIPLVYARQLIFTARYIGQKYQSPDRAVPFYEKALEVYPEAVEPYEELGYYYALKRDCVRSRKHYISASYLEKSSAPKYQKVLAEFCEDGF